MTREETASFIRAYLDGDTAIGNIIPIRDVLESAITYLTEQPTLPAWKEQAKKDWIEENASHGAFALTQDEIDFYYKK